MPNNLTLAQQPDTVCPYPIKWCGLKLCFTATDFIGGAAANAFVTLELDPDNVPWTVGSTLTIFGITFTVVSGAPTGPNQVSSSANPSTQWSNFYNALLSGITGGGQPFTDYYSVSGGYYITITSIAAGLNPPAAAGLFGGGVVVDAFADGTVGATKTDYHVVLDLFRFTDGDWQKVCGQADHTYILPVQPDGNVCFDVQNALSVWPTPPPSDGSFWYLQANAVAKYYARYASFYRDDAQACGNIYSSYDETDEFKVINAVFSLRDTDGFAPYCYGANGQNALLLTDMPSFYEVCCNNPVWWSVFIDPDSFIAPPEIEIVTEVTYEGGATNATVTAIGGGTIAQPSLLTFQVNPNGCAMPEGITERAFVQLELDPDEAPFSFGSMLTVFGLTLVAVNGTPGINEVEIGIDAASQWTNLYNALLAAEISPGVPFTSLYNVSFGFYITITAISTSYNPPNVSGYFGTAVSVYDLAAGGGGSPVSVSVVAQVVGGAWVAQPRTLTLKSGDENCCCTTPLYFIGELGNLDYIEGSCATGISLEIDDTTTGRAESCADWINSGLWEVNNVSQEVQTCYIEVKPQHEHYIRAFLKSVNKFWYDADTASYYRILPAQKKYTLRKGAEKVFIEFSFYVSYNLPNQVN